MPARISEEEPAMRELVVPHLRGAYPGGRVVHEFPLRFSAKRLDLAVIMPTEIIGVEIKSSKDTLDRLAGQLEGFANVVSRFIVALAPCWNEQRPMVKQKAKYGFAYIDDFTAAQRIVHNSRANSYTEIFDCCAATKRFEKTKAVYHENVAHPHRVLSLLHVAELKRIAMRAGIGVGTRHDIIVKKLFNEMPGKKVMEESCRQLRWRDAFCPGTDAPIFDSEMGGEAA